MREARIEELLFFIFVFVRVALPLQATWNAFQCTLCVCTDCVAMFAAISRQFLWRKVAMMVRRGALEVHVLCTC